MMNYNDIVVGKAVYHLWASPLKIEMNKFIIKNKEVLTHNGITYASLYEPEGKGFWVREGNQSEIFDTTYSSYFKCLLTYLWVKIKIWFGGSGL